MRKLIYPFQPAFLESLPTKIETLYRELETKLLIEICSRLVISDQLNEVTVQDIRALRAHGIRLSEIEDAIEEITGIAHENLETLLDDVVERNKVYYGKLADLAKITMPASIVGDAEIDAIRKQTWSSFQNLTGSMGFLVRVNGHLEMLPPVKAYWHALDMAEMEIMSGAISYNQAIDEAIQELVDSGVKTVWYEPKKEGGKPHIDSIDVAARRAVMSGVNALNQKYREQSMDLLGTDLVEVSAHSGARDIDGPLGWENHRRWQGKVYRWKRR